ncbi:MAG: hypothetical protein J0H73_11990 [Salana multivorans]|uniref:hypothetical protein n=1 Tax=Salana multivorans TaxID=120377 RepID=UPI001ACB9186|nr:hypothetical protein [Salana multivorans]MBN8883021.1 hypothetical protein [Salana multivorans]
MPTYDNPTIDAAEASEALRGLAHASRVFDQPAEMYGVIGDLSSAMRSLHQVLDQLATNHETRAAFAFNDDGNHDAGVRDALTTAEELRQAARLLDQSYDRLATGFVAAGRIAWHHDPAPEAATEAMDQTWVSVVFLQGDEADEVLDLIDTHGTQAAVEYLSSWDYGEETTSAAIANHATYETIPAGTLDKVAEHGIYTLTYNPFMGHVSLLRHPDVGEEPATPAPEPAPRRQAVRDASGYQPARRTGQPESQVLGL